MENSSNMMDAIMNHNTFKHSLLATAIFSAYSFPIVAIAENNNNADIETISILGETYRNTATKTSLVPEETPQGITVIESEQLQQRGVKSLNEALRYVPGVTTEQKGGAVTMYDTFNIRGFDVTQSYYDGLALQTLSGWNLQPQIDPILLQQVEVFKGPTSVLYGAMPPGGMVNMIAKSPSTTEETDVRFTIGSSNLIEGSIDTTGQIADSNVSYRFTALARKKDGQVDNTEEERYVIAPSLDWQVSEKTLINFNLYYQNDPAMGMNSSMPASGMIYSNANGSTNPSTFVGDTNWSNFEREVVMVGYKINHKFNNDWTFLQSARFMDASLHQENTYHIAANFDETTGDLDRNIYSTDESSQGFTIDNQLAGRITTDSVEHNLLVGIDYQKLEGDASYSEYGTTSQFANFNLFNTNNNMINRSELSKTSTYNDKISYSQVGVYAQDQLRINNLVLIAGGRYDQFKSSSDYTGQYEYDGTWYDYLATSKSDQNNFSYRVGALYEFENGISPYVSYATSFEPVAGLDGNGDAYNPELGEQFEIGLKYQSPDSSKLVSASLFNIIKSDALMADPSNPWAAKLQIGEIQSRGLELQGQWFVNDNLDLLANYTYIDMEITQDSENGLEGKTPIYVPEHAASFWSNYYIYEGALAGSRLGAGVRYVGEMQMDAANTDMVPDYTLVDLSVSYDLGYASNTLDGATATLLATNLFNTEYYSCYDSANCWYGAEQNVELNLNYKF